MAPGSQSPSQPDLLPDLLAPLGPPALRRVVPVVLVLPQREAPVGPLDLRLAVPVVLVLPQREALVGLLALPLAVLGPWVVLAAPWVGQPARLLRR